MICIILHFPIENHVICPDDLDLRVFFIGIQLQVDVNLGDMYKYHLSCDLQDYLLDMTILAPLPQQAQSEEEGEAEEPLDEQQDTNHTHGSPTCSNSNSTSDNLNEEIDNPQRQ